MGHATGCIRPTVRYLRKHLLQQNFPYIYRCKNFSPLVFLSSAYVIVLITSIGLSCDSRI